MNCSDWAIICATLLAPVLAVQAQKWVERATESRRRRQWIFTTIMANRATRLADENIKALNAIDFEYRRISAMARSLSSIAEQAAAQLTIHHAFCFNISRSFPESG